MDQEKKKKKSYTLLILILIAIVLIGTAVTVVLLMNRKSPEEVKGEGVVGVITDNWDPKISQEPEGSQKSGTQIPGYSKAEMHSGDTSLKLRIGNPKDNKVGFLATLKLSDGTVLYSSPLLRPGQGMEEVPLNQTLSPGTYQASVYYQCVLLNEEQTPLNAAESAFTLYVY